MSKNSRTRQYEKTVTVPMELTMIERLRAESVRLGGMPVTAIVRTMVESALTASASAEKHLPWEVINAVDVGM